MKCPNCGCPDLRVVDTFDSEWDCDKYYDTVEGTCPDCGKSWRWTEVYSFEREINIEPIDPNDHL